MATAALVIALVSSGLLAAQNGVTLIHMIKEPVVVMKVVHKKTTLPLYHHVLKPVGKAVVGN